VLCDSLLDTPAKSNQNETITVPYSGVAIMPSLTLKNIPDSLYDQLKSAAQTHHRSLNSEILYCVERILSPHKIDVSEQLTIARNLRNKTALHPIADIDIDSAKNDGRP
jgi:plasmid stability protein